MEAVECPSCGKAYVAKAALAGKRMKCKCGGVLEFPVATTDESSQAEEDAMYELAEPDHVAKPVGGKCPGCGAKVPKEAVLCVSCGLNFKTGKLLQTQQLSDKPMKGVVKKGPPALGASSQGAFSQNASRQGAAPPTKPPTKPSPMPGRVGIAPAGTKKIDPHAQQQKKQLFTIIGVVAGVALLVGGSVVMLQYIGESSGGGEISQRLGDDDSALKLINEDGGIEAKEWITADPARRMLGGLNEKQTLARVEDLYRLGAKKVYCSGAAICLTAVIELPTEKEKRDALFNWAKDWHEKTNDKIAKDVGQRFLLIQVPMFVPN